ncbi:MAG: gliding motility-associated C-terminal domain-containing protein [Bacteroidales bacterium]|nr:gliding motility-associated C-terminal domain-containing protein [Bacteroidales bacterium]
MKLKSIHFKILSLLLLLLFNSIIAYETELNLKSINISCDVHIKGALLQPAGPFCITDAPEDLIASIPGGTWSGNGITNPVNGTFDPSVAGAGTHTITYNSASGSETMTIHVDALANATITPAGPLCDNDFVVYLTAATNGGVWSGTGITNPTTGEFDPNIAGAGTHTIQYTVSNGARVSTETETITVYLSPDASFPPIPDVCETDPAFDIIPVNSGGTWSGTGITNPTNGTFDPGIAGPGAHQISYTLTNANCTSVAIRRINVDTLVIATITPIGPFCDDDPSVNLTSVHIGGTWSGTGITDPVNGVFNPVNAGVGTHTITYNIVSGACTDTDNIDIEVLTAPDATITDPGEFCSDDPPINLVAATPGGIWAGSGITDPNLGIFDPSIANDGGNNISYTVSNAACTRVDNITIFVYDNAVDASIISTGPFCISEGQINLTAASPGGTWSGTAIIDSNNGTFDLVLAGIGSHSITYEVGNPPCFDSDTQIIQIDDTLSAIINPVAPVCETDAAFNFTAANLGGVWTGNGITDPVNGLFDPSVASAGVHTITYTITQGACTNIDNFNMQVDEAVDATINQTGPFCETDTDVTLTAADNGGIWSGTGITDPAAGTFNPSSVSPGIYTITYSISNGTCSDSDTELFTVSTNPDSDWSIIGPFCEQDPSENIMPAIAGGVFSGTGITDPVNGTFNPQAAGPGTHNITYTLINGGCTSITTKPVIVYDDVDATITSLGPFCDNDYVLILTSAETGGLWSGPGIINPTLGGFDPELAGVGTHEIVYSISNTNCSDSDTALIVVNASPDADFTPVFDICETDPPFNLIPTNAGGVWAGVGITDDVNGTFDPSVAGAGHHMISYTLSNANCTSVKIRRLDVDPLVDASITPVGPFCEDETELILTAVDPGGTWSGTGITNTSTGAFNPAIAGVGLHTITYGLAVGACDDTASIDIQVDTIPDATIFSAGPFCETDAAINLSSLFPGGTWSGNGITNPTNGTFDPAVAGSGDFTITYDLTNGACSSQGTTVIHVDAQVDASITSVSQLCEFDPAFDLVAASPGGVWSGVGITDVNNGTFDPTIAGIALHTITYSVINGTCSDTDVITIDVSADPDPTILGAGPFCSDDPALNLVPVTTGGSWSGVGITNSSTGTFDPSAAGGGDHVITYNIAIGSCSNSSSITIHVDAGVDATITPAGPFCLYDPEINLTTASAGGVWSGAGITDINLGTFNPSVAGVGTVNITYNIVNGLCSDSDNINIDIFDAPDATITDPGEFCSNDPPITLTAASPGGIWSGSGITDPVNGIFDPSVANDGENNIIYTVSNANCTSVGSIIIYVYDDAVDATITSVGPYCISEGEITLSAISPGGVWSGNGIINANTGVFDPEIAGVGTHLITYDVGNPACFDTDTQIIQIDDTTSAIINPVSPVCENSSAFNFTAANTGGVWSGAGITNQTNGTFNPITAGAGIHTITYTITQGACTNTDSFDMHVDASVDASITPAGPFCNNQPIISLHAVDNGGTWSGNGIVNTSTGLFHPGLANIGDNIITYSIVNGTCSDTDTETIHIDALPNTTITPVGPFCENDPAINLTAATSGGFWSGNGITESFLGTFDPITAGSGNHIITYEIIDGACFNSSTLNINVDAFYDATITPAGPFCNTDLPVNLNAASTGGVWSGTGITNPTTGVFHPGISGPGDFTIHYETNNGLCSDLNSITIHVDEFVDAVISPIADYCETDPLVNLVATNPGGLWSGNGIIVPAMGTFDPATAGSGDHLITYEITTGACYSIDTETVHIDAQPDPTITHVPFLCANEPPFNLTAAQGGGVWSGNGITNSTNGTFSAFVAAAGDHIITYNIINGVCSASDTETIHVDAYPNTNLLPVGPFCETDPDVNLVEPSSGGLWTGDGITNTFTGVFSPIVAGDGTHEITYTVINGACTSAGTTNIIVNGSVNAEITDVGPFCETDAAVNLVAISLGGTWSGNGIVNSTTGLFNPSNANIGNNTITYSVQNGVCSDTDNTNIVIDAAPDVSILTTGPFCETQGNQLFIANIAGGVWSGNGIDVMGNFNPGIAGVGTHTITYTLNASACVVIKQVDITVNEFIDAEISSTGPFCYNDTPFYLSATNSGGEWSGNGTNLDGLFSPALADVGTHTITYEITNGACFDSDNQIITVNSNPDATISGPSDICLNDPIFNYTAADNGGTWSGAGITDVVAGTYNPAVSGSGSFLIVYEITVNGCSSIDFDTLTIHDIPVVTISGLNQHYCLNDEGHTVNVSPTGGVLTGDGIAGTLFDPQLAGVGSHQITYVYSDINGCSDTAYFNLEVHDMPVTSISGIDDYYCIYADTVYPVVLPLGGTLVGQETLNNLFIPQLAGAGEFELMYHFTDIYGCSDTSYINTSVIDYSTIEFDITQPLCFADSNGVVIANITEGITPFSYLWSDFDASTTNDITNVSSGWYHLSVTDSLACITVDSVFVDQPDELIVDVISHSNARCYGIEDAWALASASGGTPEYQFLWNDALSTDSTLLENIPVGNYIVTVTDNNLCQATDTAYISEPDTLSLSFTDILNPSCYMYNDGVVTVIPEGGTPEYTAVWNDADTTTGFTVSNLSAGYYSVTITDNNNCQISDSILITQPDSLYLEAIINPVICTQQTGSVVITAHGGTSPYNYYWSSGDTLAILNNVISQTYGLTIEDANSCSIDTSFFVPAEGNINASITQTYHNLCFGDKIAELIAFSNLAAMPISYQWSNFVIDSVNPNLPAGEYFVTITDAWGCSGIDSIIVSEPEKLIVEVTSQDIKCKGELTGIANVEIQGGTPFYTVEWQNGDSGFITTGLGPGPIWVTVTDANNCSESGHSIISEPLTGITIDANVKQVTCYGAEDGEINAFASGGNPPYWFTWYINGVEINSATIRNLDPGFYTLMVSDNNGCTKDTVIQIYTVNSLTATVEVGKTSCIGNYDGYIAIYAEGGTEPYSYYLMGTQWNSNIIDSLCSGEYYISVLDTNNCEFNLGPIIVEDTDEDCLRIPAAFSPNGDGYNDEFFIENLHLYPRAVVQIFNRWGQLLYEEPGTKGFWDGTYKGKPVPTGAYLYNIILNIDEDPRVGTITIIR